jgi:hypothetical protein
MKFALCFRGITYLDSYNHCHGLPIYKIDFRDTYSSIKENIIDDIITNGNNLDTFITTYNSILNDELINIYSPKKYNFTDYSDVPFDNIEEITAKIYIKQTLELISMIETYENEKNFKYDFIIITRSDLYFYQKFTKINIDYNVFNFPFWHMNGSIFSSEDNFIAFPRNKLIIFKTILNNIINCIYLNIPIHLVGKHITLHQLGKFLLDSGETVQYLYGEKGEGAYDYPIYKFGRHIFGNAKKYTIEEILKIPMNRIYHSLEEKNNLIPISLKLK